MKSTHAKIEKRDPLSINDYTHSYLFIWDNIPRDVGKDVFYFFTEKSNLSRDFFLTCAMTTFLCEITGSFCLIIKIEFQKSLKLFLLGSDIYLLMLDSNPNQTWKGFGGSCETSIAIWKQSLLYLLLNIYSLFFNSKFKFSCPFPKRFQRFQKFPQVIKQIIKLSLRHLRMV